VGKTCLSALFMKHLRFIIDLRLSTGGLGSNSEKDFMLVG
jgi:hypothetical protein